MLMAIGDIHSERENVDKILQREQALARDCFSLFAGLQGWRNYVGCFYNVSVCIRAYLDVFGPCAGYKLELFNQFMLKTFNF